jgi:hypothetical protein
MNTTPLSEIPDLDDLEPQDITQSSHSYQGSQFIPEEHVDRTRKYIKPSHTLHADSGMMSHSMGVTPINENFYDDFSIPSKQENNTQSFDQNMHGPSCLDFAKHYANCPICSKFYKDDKTIYIIIICILIAICLILGKKVLD